MRFIFHSKFIVPSINTHIVKHCDGINMFSSSEFSHTQHFSIFWFISRFFGTSITILFLQRFKTQCREIFLKHSIVNLLILFQRRIYHYFEHITFNVLILFQRRIYYFFHFFLVPLYNLRNWYGNIILFIYSIFFFITTRTFVRFIFHSKFIERTINNNQYINKILLLNNFRNKLYKN